MGCVLLVPLFHPFLSAFQGFEILALGKSHCQVCAIVLLGDAFADFFVVAQVYFGGG